ncbi:sugar transferase [Haloarcula montana]|uniref:sugar transferase n=1 Tax=Haloarcula montana TaxID=3111776 RepID=UPI002D76F19F|nr:sugar transferase [Haloarcula sp. GH36]
MISGWRYRLAAVGGVLCLTTLAVTVSNLPIVQHAITSLPVLNNLQPETYGNGDLLDEIVTTAVVVVGALWPLFKPRPRRILDTVELSHKRVMLAATGLATIGYFDWSTRLPRTTLVASVLCLLVVIPGWFVFIRQRPRTSRRAVIVGDDATIMARLQDAATMDVVGYVAPPNPVTTPPEQATRYVTDGGDELNLRRLGGLSGLTDVLVEHDIDTVLLGFRHPDREEFFGTLAACYEHGIQAMVHRQHADGVLIADTDGSDLVRTDLEPWDLQDYILKRSFDVLFASSALLVLSPVILVIAAAIKVDSAGPVLYAQRRTASFGDTFTVYKFRSMVTGAEAETGPQISAEDAGGIDPRITRVGHVLRTTHLDEIPQLLAVLRGDMSVVGPRPERPELDADIDSTVSGWRSRWFVKPGLTGLAQINDVTGHDPQTKLRYDIEYIQNQSLAFDAKIVVRQLYQVAIDSLRFLLSRDDSDE